MSSVPTSVRPPGLFDRLMRSVLQAGPIRPQKESLDPKPLLSAYARTAARYPVALATVLIATTIERVAYVFVPIVLKGFIDEIPREYEEAAMIDGYTRLQAFRKVIYEAVKRTSIGGELPIQHPIDLDVLFVNPASPDLGNAYLALEMALDDKTLTKPGIVADDSLIQAVKMSKYFPQGERKR